MVHFFHAEFVSCKVMDKHLRVIAAKVPTTRFLKINGEQCCQPAAGRSVI